MTGITLGSIPITGVYAEGRLATGVYVGAKRVWPALALGEFPIGVGRFRLQPRGLLAETGHSIRVGARPLTFAGRPLSVAVATAFAASMGRATLRMDGTAAAVSSAARPALGASTLSFGTRAPTALSGQSISVTAGAMRFTAEALTTGTARALAVDVVPGAFRFTPQTLAPVLGATFSADMAAAALHFAAHALAASTGSAVAAALGAGALALHGAAVAPAQAASVAIVPGLHELAGAALSVTAGGRAALGAGALALTSQALEASVSAAPSNIVPVGSKSTSALLLFGQGITSQTFQAALPSGCAAGDTVVLSCNGQNAQNFAWAQPTGGSTPLANTVYGAALAAIFLYTLAQADVDAGYVGVPCTALEGSGIDVSILADVRRTVSQNALDVIGTLATGVIGSSGTTDCTASSITTLTDKDLLSYSLFMDTANTAVITAPAGWTQGDTPNASHTRTFSAYIEQDTKGATGSVTAQSSPISGGAHYAIVLLAIRVKKAAIILSATFPTSLHVGDNVSFDVTATLVDGATGTPTIEVDQLPAGLTLAATSQVDATHYKATCSGTLTTVQDVTATFSATGGSVAATALVHEFVVQAAASGSPARVQSNYAIVNTAALRIPLNTKATAGNLLLVTCDYNLTSQGSPSMAGWTPVPNSTINLTGARWTTRFSKVSDGTETEATVTFAVAALCYGTITEYSNGKLGTLTSGVGTITKAANRSDPRMLRCRRTPSRTWLSTQRPRAA